MPWKTEKLRQYLLGDLPESEKEALELQIFTDKELVESLLIAEDELVDDYLDETLSVEEREAFNFYFLNSPQRVEQMRFLQSLKTYAKKQYQSHDTHLSPRASFYAFLKNLFSKNFYPAFALSAAGIIVLCVAGYLFLNSKFQENNNPVQSEIARLNQKSLGNLADYADFSRLSLTPGALRDENSLKSLQKEDLTEAVLLRLALPEGIEDNSFQIKIWRDGGDVLAALPQINPISSQGGREIRLLLPSAQLSPGVYRIDVQPTGRMEDNIASHFFSIR